MTYHSTSSRRGMLRTTANQCDLWRSTDAGTGGASCHPAETGRRRRSGRLGCAGADSGCGLREPLGSSMGSERRLTAEKPEGIEAPVPATVLRFGGTVWREATNGGDHARCAPPPPPPSCPVPGGARATTSPELSTRSRVRELHRWRHLYQPPGTTSSRHHRCHNRRP